MKNKICFGVIFFILLIGISNVHFAVERRTGIENFPNSYKPYLLELQSKHPNWKFTALYTDLDWNYVISCENKFGTSLVPKSYSDRWKNTKSGEYNVEVDAGWVDASRRAIEFAMDPRNFLNEVRIFQFEGLSYDESTNNIEGIEKILYGTEFYDRIVQYFDSAGRSITMSKKYSDLILSAGRISSVSSYHLASRIKQEVGPFLSHSSISGTVPGYEGLYNFYNIGATSSSEPMGAIKNGLRYARDGNGANQSTKDKYIIPWNTKERAITGGGIFIGSSYIHLGQDTIYLQKFHVIDNRGGTLFWHQYMTNILAPYSESKLIYNGYSNSGMLYNDISFIIPVYNNMPNTPVENPNILESDFKADNTIVQADVSTTLNVRNGPSTSYEVISSVDRTVSMTRIGLGVQSGELWDKVILPNGIVGYVFHSYLKEVTFTPKFEKSELSFDPSLTVQNNEISGWDPANMNVGNIKSKITSRYTVEVYNANGIRLDDNELAGTGCRIRIIDGNTVKMEYYIVLYGDVDGDGKITSIDLLVLQRHVLEINMLSGVYYKAGNTAKNGDNPNSIDLLIIQRHILGIKELEQ